MTSVTSNTYCNCDFHSNLHHTYFQLVNNNSSPIRIYHLCYSITAKNSPIRECSESFNDWLEFTISWTPSTKVLMRIIKFPLLWVQNSIPINCTGKDISAMSNPANYNNKNIILLYNVMWCLQMGTILIRIYNPWVESNHINVAKPM